MSDAEPTFIDLSMRGEAMLDEIDEFVDSWHDNPHGVELPDFLGMTIDEYSLWVVSPDSLAYIVAARHHNISLTKVVNDNFEEYKLAARASDADKIRQLESWLRSQGYDF